MTPQIHLHVLASGSKGNATVVEGPGGSVLIDCGLSRRELGRRADELGVDLGRVSAVLLTHEHSDHTSGLTVFCNRFEGELVTTAGTMSARTYLTGLPFTLVSPGEEVRLAGMRVITFPTSHDVADPMGFRFETDDDALGYCTDTGVLPPLARHLLTDARILAIESNHDERMLRTGPYPSFLKARVGGPTGHLSNAQTAELLPGLVGPDTETVVAMHLSDKNNRPSVCVRTLAEAIGAKKVDDLGVEARTPNGRVTIVPAAQDAPLTVW